MAFGRLFGMSNTASNIKTETSNITSNLSVNSTELESVSKVFQEILNEADTELNTNSNIKNTNENDFDMNIDIGDMNINGNKNKTKISQDASGSTSITAGKVINAICDSKFTIQQKFLLARALDLTNDNVNSYLGTQAATNIAESSNGSNPNIGCQSSPSFGMANCITNVNKVITNRSDAKSLAYLTKKNNEDTHVSQKNVTKVENFITDVIMNTSMNTIKMNIKIGSFNITGNENLTEIEQKAKIVNTIKNQIDSAVKSNAIHASESDTNNSYSEKIDNKYSNVTQVDQTAIDKTKITDTAAVIGTIVAGIIVFVIIIFLIRYFVKKHKGLIESYDPSFYDKDLNESDFDDKDKELVKQINNRRHKNGGTFNGIFKDRKLYEATMKLTPLI